MARPKLSELQQAINKMRTRAWFRHIQKRATQTDGWKAHPKQSNNEPTQIDLLNFLTSTARTAIELGSFNFSRWMNGGNCPSLSTLNLFNNTWPFLQGSYDFYMYGPGNSKEDGGHDSESLKCAPLFFALWEENAFNLLKKMPESFLSAFVEITHGQRLSSVFENKVLDAERSASKFGLYPTVEDVLSEETTQFRLAQLAGCFMLLRFLVLTLHQPMYVLNALRALIRSTSVRQDLEDISVSPLEYADLMTRVLHRDLEKVTEIFGKNTPRFVTELSEFRFVEAA